MTNPASPSTNGSLSYEDLAKSAQQFLANRPVVILGTGTTIPHGLPSMATLSDSLLEIVEGNPSGWDVFSRRLRETRDLEQTLSDVALPIETVEILIKATWEIVSMKDIDFYNQLLTMSGSFPLAEMFRYLLRTADSHLWVVTTNYDRVAEYAANYVRAYASTGVTPGWLQRFTPDAVNTGRPPSPGFEGLVTILKVHGSLDWFRDETDDIVAIPLSRSIPQDMKPLIVTPGVSKYRAVHKDPFRTVMTAADDVLRKATCYVCVGYGFNDEHVQPVLLNRVRKDSIPLLIVTKELTPQIREAFLEPPTGKFLFIEEADGGTRIYTPDYIEGVLISGVSAWQLGGFMELIFGKKVR